MNDIEKQQPCFSVKKSCPICVGEKTKSHHDDKLPIVKTIDALAWKHNLLLIIFMNFYRDRYFCRENDLSDLEAFKTNLWIEQTPIDI